MAVDRTTANQITARINSNRREATRITCAIGIPAAIIASYFYPPVAPIWLLTLLACILIVRSAGPNGSIQGAAGEERVKTALDGLPAEYTVFNQIRMPDERSRTGFREADFIVLGPNGVFIVENKCFRGVLVGDEFSRTWEQHKVGRGGTPYVGHGRNPVRQVKGYVNLLGGIFRDNGIKAWLTPIVSLSRENRLDWIKSKVKVVQTSNLCNAILSNQGRVTEENREKVLRVLEDLRAGQQSLAEVNQKAA